MNESLEDEHSLFGSWFRDVKKNAVSLCKLANSSEWKRSDIVDALNAILTRKIAGRDQNLNHEANSELLHSKGFDRVCQILVRNSARKISRETINLKEFEDENGNETEDRIIKEKSNDPVNRSH